VCEAMVKLEQWIKKKTDEVVAILVVVRAKSRLPHDTIMHQHPGLVSASAVGSVVRVVASKRGVEEIKAEVKQPAISRQPSKDVLF
jgi:hypothetical protein